MDRRDLTGIRVAFGTSYSRISNNVGENKTAVFVLKDLPAFLCLILNEFNLSLPRLRSRPKFSSDQTFQTKNISDQTFQTKIHPDQTFQAQFTSEQTFQTQKVSDQTFQTRGILIRPSSDHGPDSNSGQSGQIIYDQTEVRLKPVLTRLKRAGNSLIRKRSYL